MLPVSKEVVNKLFSFLFIKEESVCLPAIWTHFSDMSADSVVQNRGFGREERKDVEEHW
jgi:hypothetical protein